LDKPKSISKRSGKAWSAALLLLCLLALVLGVFGAVYFEQTQPGTPQVASNPPPATSPAAGPVAPAPVAQPPAVTSPAENTPSPQAVPSPESPAQAAQAASPAPASPPAEAPPSPSSSAAQRLAQISPSAAPANIAAAAPRYWVEFGAYEGSFYAERLKQSLDKLGIAATVAEAPGAHGRKYLRVRGADQSDRTAALAQLGKAHDALHIAPLLHRVAAVSAGATRPAATAPARGTHWVQFGAFRSPKGAERTLASLRKNGIQASVLKVKFQKHSSLYLVRVADLPDRAAAAQIAQRGSAALHSNDVLIGERPRRVGLNPRAPPRELTPRR
jgi:cell division protein FtsN